MMNELTRWLDSQRIDYRIGVQRLEGMRRYFHEFCRDGAFEVEPVLGREVCLKAVGHGIYRHSQLISKPYFQSTALFAFYLFIFLPGGTSFPYLGTLPTTIRPPDAPAMRRRASGTPAVGASGRLSACCVCSSAVSSPSLPPAPSSMGLSVCLIRLSSLSASALRVFSSSSLRQGISMTCCNCGIFVAAAAVSSFFYPFFPMASRPFFDLRVQFR